MGRKKLNLWASSKVCSKCKQDIHLDFYHRNKAKPLGVESSCKNCFLFAKRQSYKAKKQKEKEQALIDYLVAFSSI